MVIPFINKALDSVNQIILGKDHHIRLIFACLLAKGHLLIEDLPGMGKTILSQALAKVLGLEYKRIQFTSDLLPADIIGCQIFDKDNSEFTFRPGPVFTQLILADEINRATPKAQGALLEAMEERQVTVDGITMALPKPFFVIATQNPVTQMGTYALPESQLDRFLMRISLGYPNPEYEREIILGQDRRAMIAAIKPVVEKSELLDMQKKLIKVHLSDALVSYVQRLSQYSREQADLVEFGISPRATLAVVTAARAWAFMNGRDHVIPSDVQAIFVPVIEHRLVASGKQFEQSNSGIAQKILESVPVIGN